MELLLDLLDSRFVGSALLVYSSAQLRGLDYLRLFLVLSALLETMADFRWKQRGRVIFEHWKFELGEALWVHHHIRGDLEERLFLFV